ncbi:HAD family hydrolase [Candidatus Sumerlaeota bacterium]|nr:HAD family hydrolase [Candidatus Sumerlaeota bacterium]
MTPALFITDLDGTLLRDDSTLSVRSSEALQRMLAEGLPLSIATARSIVSIREILGDLPLTLPVIENNGAFLSDLWTGEHFLIHDLPSHAPEEILALGIDHGCRPIVSSTDGRNDHLTCEGARNEGMGWYVENRSRYRDSRYREVSDIREAFERRVTCLTFIERQGVLERLHAALHSHLDGRLMMDLYENRYSRGWWWLTVQDVAVSKGHGLRALAERLRVDPANTVAFGDASNDIPMLEAAGHAVAVANALDEVKAVADEVIGSNEDDSVVGWLEGGC